MSGSNWIQQAKDNHQALNAYADQLEARVKELTEALKDTVIGYVPSNWTRDAALGIRELAGQKLRELSQKGLPKRPARWLW